MDRCTGVERFTSATWALAIGVGVAFDPTTPGVAPALYEASAITGDTPAPYGADARAVLLEMPTDVLPIGPGMLGPSLGPCSPMTTSTTPPTTKASATAQMSHRTLLLRTIISTPPN
jgi:hypothetical protein